MRILTLSALMAALAAAPAAAVVPAPDPDAMPAMDEVTVMDFTCAEDTGFTALFLNTAGGNSYAVTAMDEQPVWFEIAVSASGARYVSQPVNLDGDEGAGTQLELWTKGKTATLSILDGDETAPLLVDCTAE